MASNDIISKAKDLRANHNGQSFNINYAKAKYVQTIANRFTEHKRTNVSQLKNIERVIQYMIAAKMVGDRRLYKELNDYTNDVLDIFCEDIEIQDNCYDGFDTAVERHLYRANKEVYDYLHAKHIKFLDAGLVRFKHGQDIFLPAFNAIINVVDNHKCLVDLKKFVDETPEEDRHNNENTFTLKVLKKFIVFDNKLYVSNKDSDPVELNDITVHEYLVDSETDPDDIFTSKYVKNDVANGEASISLHREVSITKLKNYDEVMIKNGVVYHDDKNNIYKLVGNYELMHLIRYDNLNSMSVVYECPGHGKEQSHTSKIKLGNLNKVYDPMTIDKFKEDYQEDSISTHFLYLYRGNSKLGQLQHRSNGHDTITFEMLKELLDKTK